jgi:hypothetical protein
VSQRIQRGIESIRRDFAQRGIALSAAALGPLLAANACAAPLSLKASLGKLAIAAGTTGPGGAVATTSLIGSLLIMKTKFLLPVIAVCIIIIGALSISSKMEKPAEPVSPEASLAESTRPSDSIETTSMRMISAPPAPQASEANVESSLSMEALLALSKQALGNGLDAFPLIENSAEFASISGVVLDSNGYPIEGASVAAIPRIGWSILPGAEGAIFSARSAADGSYRIENITLPYSYIVNASKDGYVHGARGTLPDGMIDIVPGMKAEGIDFTLAKGVTVEGRVLSAKGELVPGALVQGITLTSARSASMFNSNAIQTDHNGRFGLGFEEKHR